MAAAGARRDTYVATSASCARCHRCRSVGPARFMRAAAGMINDRAWEVGRSGRRPGGVANSELVLPPTPFFSDATVHWTFRVSLFRGLAISRAVRDQIANDHDDTASSLLDNSISSSHCFFFYSFSVSVSRFRFRSIYLIICTIQLIFLTETMFFSHNNSTTTVFFSQFSQFQRRPSSEITCLTLSLV